MVHLRAARHAPIGGYGKTKARSADPSHDARPKWPPGRASVGSVRAQVEDFHPPEPNSLEDCAIPKEVACS